LNQQKNFQEEISRLKDTIQNITPSNNSQYDSSLVQQQISELEQYKQINSKLQDRIIELQNQISLPENDPKINQLKKVKEETMDQIHNLKVVQEDIATNVNLNKNLESLIKKLITDNLSKFENSEETLFINSHETKFHTPLNNVTSIEFKDFDLPFDKYTITSNNNKLIFIRLNQDINNENDHQSESESDTANVIDSDIESLIDVAVDGSNIELSIITGIYNIDDLCKMINKHLLKYGINISCSKNTNLITFKSNTKFDLQIDDNSLFSNLGFSKMNQDKYKDKNKYTGSKAYDFKVDKCMNIYIMNINDKKPIMQLILNNPQQTKKIIFKPVISELNKICLKFVDSKGKEYIFDSDNGLEFGIQLVIKHIGQTYIDIDNDEIQEVSSDDVFNIVKNNLTSN